MKSFHVHVLLDIAAELAGRAEWAHEGSQWANVRLSEGEQASSLRNLSDAARLCLDFGFKPLSREVERNLASVKEGCTYSELSQIAGNLMTRIQDEFEDVLFLWIEEKGYYQRDELFGLQVAERFKGATVDIKEAGNCYALGRYTACVYHSMRVAEFGLQAIAQRVGFPDNRPMWEPVLHFINAELHKSRDKMSELFKGDLEFLGGIAAHMHAVNLAWRRRVAHVERVYAPEEAKRILDETKYLMQHVAVKLSESE